MFRFLLYRVRLSVCVCEISLRFRDLETVQTAFTDQLLMDRASHAWPHCRADSSYRINFITQSSASRLPSLWRCER